MQCDCDMFSLSSLPRRVLGGSLGLARCQQLPHVPTLSPLIFTRGRGQLAPKQVKHAKRHKGRVPIPIGGSTKGTTLAYGEWGIRIKGNGARLSAKQLSTAQEVIIKKLKALKGTKVYLRVFPDIPVCIKVKFHLSLQKVCRYEIYCKSLGQRNPYGKRKGNIRILGDSVNSNFFSS